MNSPNDCKPKGIMRLLKKNWKSKWFSKFQYPKHVYLYHNMSFCSLASFNDHNLTIVRYTQVENAVSKKFFK